MYDYFYINKEKLPLSEDVKNNIPEDIVWQTNSMENVLTEIYITEDNELLVNNYELETVPEAERPYPNSTGIMSLFGSIRRINERKERSYYTGDIYFWGRVDGRWLEFKATLNNGILQNIVEDRRNNLDT